jgi:hypothetical protein
LRQDSLFPAQNLPITLLSRVVPIGGLLTRSLHNLLHRRMGDHERNLKPESR